MDQEIILFVGSDKTPINVSYTCRCMDLYKEAASIVDPNCVSFVLFYGDKEIPDNEEEISDLGICPESNITIGNVNYSYFHFHVNVSEDETSYSIWVKSNREKEAICRKLNIDSNVDFTDTWGYEETLHHVLSYHANGERGEECLNILKEHGNLIIFSRKDRTWVDDWDDYVWELVDIITWDHNLELRSHCKNEYVNLMRYQEMEKKFYQNKKENVYLLELKNKREEIRVMTTNVTSVNKFSKLGFKVHKLYKNKIGYGKGYYIINDQFVLWSLFQYDTVVRTYCRPNNSYFIEDKLYILDRDKDQFVLQDEPAGLRK